MESYKEMATLALGTTYFVKLQNFFMSNLQGLFTLRETFLPISLATIIARVNWTYLLFFSNLKFNLTKNVFINKARIGQESLSTEPPNVELFTSKCICSLFYYAYTQTICTWRYQINISFFITKIKMYHLNSLEGV